MIINRSGLTIRLRISELRVTGRATQGVKLINLKKNDSIAAIANVESADDIQESNQIEGETNDTVIVDE